MKHSRCRSNAKHEMSFLIRRIWQMRLRPRNIRRIKRTFISSANNEHVRSVGPCQCCRQSSSCSRCCNRRHCHCRHRRHRQCCHYRQYCHQNSHATTLTSNHPPPTTAIDLTKHFDCKRILIRSVRKGNLCPFFAALHLIVEIML